MADPRLARPSWRGRTNVDALTIACIEHAEAIGGHEFGVTQGSYQAGGGASQSAGTHDLGGVVDLRWCGHDSCIKALRQAGMFAWHRNPRQGPWPDHIHAGVLGHPYMAASARRQEASYRAGRNGLANNAADDGPRLDPIPEPVWPWPQEDDMPLSDDDLAKVRALVSEAVAEQVAKLPTPAAPPSASEVARTVWAYIVDDRDTTNARKALRRLFRATQPQEENPS